MTNKEAIQIISQEYLCVDRDCDIERSCGKCDLMMPSKEPILQAYKMAIQALEQTQLADGDRAISLTILDAKYNRNISIEQAKKYLYAKIDGLCDDEYNTFSKIIDDMYNELPSVTPQPCEDAISREKVLLMIDTLKDNYGSFNYGSLIDLSRDVRKMLPVNPRKTGHWINIYKNGRDTVIALRCSECGGSPYRAHKSDFCPYCGSYNGGNDNE